MVKTAEYPLFTTADILAAANLDLARRAASGDKSAEKMLEINIRASMLEAKMSLASLKTGQRGSNPEA